MKGRLKELRLLRRLSQKIVGQEIGVTQQNLSRYENDISRIPVDILIRLSEYYNVSTDYILGLTQERHLVSRNGGSKRSVENLDFIELYRTFSTREKQFLWRVAVELKEINFSKKDKQDTRTLS